MPGHEPVCQSTNAIAVCYPKNGPNAAINEQLLTLTGFLHDDLPLIVRGNKLSKAQENAALVYCSCESQRAGDLSDTSGAGSAALLGRCARKTAQLRTDDAANQVLCYCYEGNPLALAPGTWSVLSLLWPDGKLTLPRVEQAVNDAAHFTPFHWG